MDKKIIWESCLEKIKSELSPITYDFNCTYACCKKNVNGKL